LQPLVPAWLLLLLLLVLLLEEVAVVLLPSPPNSPCWVRVQSLRWMQEGPLPLQQT
jgi:hypothetical protein